MTNEELDALVHSLGVRGKQDREMNNHYVRRMEVKRVAAINAITALRTKLEAAHDDITRLTASNAELATESEQLRADLAKAMEALKFYADWELEEMEPPSKEEAEAYDFILNLPTPKALFDEGEKARAAMASIGKAAP